MITALDLKALGELLKQGIMCRLIQRKGDQPDSALGVLVVAPKLTSPSLIRSIRHSR